MSLTMSQSMNLTVPASVNIEGHGNYQMTKILSKFATIKPVTVVMKKLPLIVRTFISMAEKSVDNEKGIYPHILMYETQDGKTHVSAMAMNPEELYVAIKKIMDKETPVQLIVGTDRNNKEGQGIDMKYHSVLTMAYYAIGQWSIGALPYSSATDFGIIQWNNTWWVGAVTKELKTFNLIEPSITGLYKQNILTIK